jgi:ubiquinone/menaquinone biosynthesis C-methylase UbiE
MAFAYDFISYLVSLGTWRCWQQTVLRYLSESDENLILELAHGTGNLQIDLHSRGFQSIGYDLSSAMGHIACNKLRSRGMPARLVQGKAQQLPFTSELFSTVITTFPTDFIVLPATLQEIHRVLRSYGQLIIVPNGILTGSGLCSRILEGLYRITGQRDKVDWNIKLFSGNYRFHARVTEHECPQSRVPVIIAKKIV